MRAFASMQHHRPASGVYALGAMLYKVLSGRSPYSGTDSTSVLDQVRSGPPASLRNMPSPGARLKFGLILRPDARRDQGPPLPPSLLATCERAMARDPEDRFASAMDLAAELQAWLEGSKRQEEARPRWSTAPRPRPPPTSTPLVWSPGSCSQVAAPAPRDLWAPRWAGT